MRYAGTLVGILVMAALILPGCAKKKAAPAVEQPAPQVEAATPQKDVFDEFYDEGGAKKTAEAAAAKNERTFGTGAKAAAGSYSFDPDGRYTVQVSCVTSELLANRLAKKLEGEGFPAYTAQVDNPTPALNGRFYRVRIGGFTGVSAAKGFGEEALVTRGYEYWVDNKSNDHVGMEGYGMGSGQATETYSSPSSSSGYGSSSTGSTWSAETPSYGGASTTESAPASSPATETGASTSAATPAPATAAPAEPAPAAAEPAPAASSTAQSPAPAQEPPAQTPAAAPAGGAGTGSSGTSTGGTDDWGNDWGGGSNSGW